MDPHLTCIFRSEKRVKYGRAHWEHESENRSWLYRLEEMQFFRLGSFTLGGMPGKPFWSSVVA